MEGLSIAWAVLTTTPAILAAAFGVAWGIVGGALPGISPSISMALILPFTYGMNPVVAIILLASVYVGAEYGGSIPAILISTPGTNAATVTVLDGYQMRLQGRGGEALGISLVTGWVGGMAGIVILIFLSGWLADVALLFNLLFIMGVLAYFKATLTLPGIAGIILTVGVGVDTNVLVFERIREELRAGKTVRMAIQNGFDRVLTTILDTHVTGLIAAAFLFQFGTGPIKGFAVTVVIGLVANVFASYFVSKLLFEWVLGTRHVEKLSI